MKTPFNLDLKVRRRKAGLSQGDVAHLIGVHPSKISLLERGRMLPNLKDIAALSVVFGKSFEEFIHAVLSSARHQIAERIHSMPPAPKRWLPRFNRDHTIEVMATELNVQASSYEEA
jgi:transcriptional regulator with XRE-family HTH domain